MSPTNTPKRHRWIWPLLVILFVVNVSVLIALWMTPMPDMTTLPGHTPKHELTPYTPDK